MNSNKQEHNWLHVCLILGGILLYIVMVGFNILAATGSSSPLFKSSTGSISDSFYIEITPAGWVFSIVWTVIFVWQFIWLIYSFICMLRRLPDNDLLYRKIEFIHYGIHIAFAVNNAVIIAWLFVWDNKYLGWALFLIVIATLSLHFCLFISFRQGYLLRETMYKQELKLDVWLNRIILQNGIGFFITWLSLASNLNFSMFLSYEAGVSQPIASTVALIIILLIIVTYFVLENFIWQRYLLYLFTPWFVLNIALIGSVTKNWISSSPSRNNIITLVLLIIVILLSVTKIIMFILYHTILKRRVNRVICNKSSAIGQSSQL